VKGLSEGKFVLDSVADAKVEGLNVTDEVRLVKVEVKPAPEAKPPFDVDFALTLSTILLTLVVVLA
jgi:hypothetical protein